MCPGSSLASTGLLYNGPAIALYNSTRAHCSPAAHNKKHSTQHIKNPISKELKQDRQYSLRFQAQTLLFQFQLSKWKEALQILITVTIFSPPAQAQITGIEVLRDNEKLFRIATPPEEKEAPC
ncbi:hypothetical protein AV530_010678 [Patagioenas fasciata monilis]|uniref:Uncharacterized protein n=1 Tax=Patagioenas fasciata monilis TaxID=372326 RepID=A0A1V4K7K4_PATFA|nr:hypothetical protein AV530_010678 [Patagioenas fasciata monilis]